MDGEIPIWHGAKDREGMDAEILDRVGTVYRDVAEIVRSLPQPSDCLE